MNRILHVVYQMERGGAETWLMHVLRHIDRSRFRFDFLVHVAKQRAYDDEILSLGGRLFHAPHPSKMWAYGRYVRRVLRDEGPFAAVHCHTHLFDGHVLRLSARAGIPLRIVHSHNSAFDRPPGLLHEMYARINRHWMTKYVTRGLACSEAAAATEFGERWKADPRWSILPYGLDFAPFRASFDPREVRRELGIPADARVVGHVGRFFPQKNHAFLVQIARQIAVRNPRVHFLFVGEGILMSEIQRQVTAVGIADRVTFAGVRSDIPRLMLAAMDLFLFPSLYEGLGLVLVEAQAAGRPCVCSDVIPPEADAIPTLIRRVPLAETAAAWAGIVQGILEVPPAITKANALAAVEESPFNISKTIGQLERLYSSVQPRPDARKERSSV